MRRAEALTADAASAGSQPRDSRRTSHAQHDDRQPSHGLPPDRRRGGVPPRGARLARRQPAARAGARPRYRKPEAPAEKVAFARRWQRTLHDGGWAGLAWPQEYGGRGATPLEQFIFAEEYARVGAPPMIDIGVGPGLVGPTLIHRGTEAAEAALPAAHPRAATTSGARASRSRTPAPTSPACRTRGELRRRRLPRHRPEDLDQLRALRRLVHPGRRAPTSQAPKHKGLTFLLVDMKSPGITIRPLVEMTGVAWFNEVFFDDVRVPRDEHGRRARTTAGRSPSPRSRTSAAAPRRTRASPASCADVLGAGRAEPRRPAAAADPRCRQRLAQLVDRDRDRCGSSPTAGERHHAHRPARARGLVS